MSGAPYVQLTGRKVIKTVVFNAIAITDTTVHIVNPSVDQTQFSEMFIAASSTLNQPAAINFYVNGGTGLSTIAGDTTSKVSFTMGVSDGSYEFVSKNQIYLLGIPGETLSIGVACSTAPTSGSFSLYLYGIPN